MFNVSISGVEKDYTVLLKREEGEIKLSLVSLKGLKEEQGKFLNGMQGYEEMNSFSIFTITEEEKEKMIKIVKSKIKMFESLKIKTIKKVYEAFLVFLLEIQV